MQVCGLPQGCVKSFVLDNDPIPRAMLSVDPTFALLKQSTPVSLLLETRRRLFGSGASFTPERFLYENVGEVSGHGATNSFFSRKLLKGIPEQWFFVHDYCCEAALSVSGVFDTMVCRSWAEGE